MTNMTWTRKMGTALSVAALAAGVGVAPAAAQTLGNTTLPSGSTMGPACSASATAEIVQTGTDSAYAYTVPPGGGSISSWSFNTTGAKAGTPYTFLVARPSGSNYKIIGTDSQTVPAALPPVATFSLAKPILVQGGDVLGVVISGRANTVDCRFKGGVLPNADVVGNGFAAPTVGNNFGVINSTPNELVNVAANLVQGNDIAVTQQVLPATITVGGIGVLVLNVTNSGPSQTSVTLTDTIPSGLTIKSVSAGTTPCSISGQNISCGLSGAPASVAIVVSGTAAGIYTNTATATGTLPDSNPGNNTAAGTLTVH